MFASAQSCASVLISWGTVFLGKLKNHPGSQEIELLWFNAVFSRARCWTLSSASWIQSTNPPLFTKIYVLSFHLFVCPASGLSPTCLNYTFLCAFYLSHACFMLYLTLLHFITCKCVYSVLTSFGSMYSPECPVLNTTSPLLGWETSFHVDGKQYVKL